MKTRLRRRRDNALIETETETRTLLKSDFYFRFRRQCQRGLISTLCGILCRLVRKKNLRDMQIPKGESCQNRIGPIHCRFRRLSELFQKQQAPNRHLAIIGCR